MCPDILVVNFFFWWLPLSAKAVSIYRLTGSRELRYQCFYVICFISKHFARLTRQTRRQTGIKHNLLTIRTKDWSALRPLRAKCKTLGRVVSLYLRTVLNWLRPLVTTGWQTAWHGDWDVWCRHASCPHLVRGGRVSRLGHLKLKTCYFKHF